ncbi:MULTISPECIES: VCBS repeat-containing protein [unclassified Pseudofrankia]|uniref:FG-GAP repeat domain-containing protein n=1 Tax=unclassified Pseudofrankia TaxID=2994372 RepID=UPI0008D95A7E|nr:MULTISPECIES: VCBS repeat-containing protein [unclassified Pseudofrankia]MDT3445238.1 VCBS repeat-containing protein [Pseudofrankia sp. BMG5.37]OHV51882.1 hypothetical protein BCD48_09785 [Pseudofrankia sp. BMG5.36]
MNGSEQSQLSPEELSRLLHAAVDPVRPSPEAYQRIRAGVERRGRFRIPLLAAGGAVLAGLVVLTVLLMRPSPSSQVVEPASRLSLTPGTAAQSDPSVGTSGTGTTPRGSSTPDPSQSATLPVLTPPVNPMSTRPTTPSSTGPDENSPTRPPLTGGRPAIAGDVDGDGKADTVRLAGATVEVALSRGETATVTLRDGATATKWAGFDLDGDGFSELVVQTGSSGGVNQFAVLRFMALDQISELDDTAAQPVTTGTISTGSTTTGTGFSCSASGIQLVVGTSTDGGANYDVTTTTIAATMDGLTKVGTPLRSTLPAASATPSFAARCGSWSS